MAGRSPARKESILADEGLQRVLWALALILLSILLALSLIPVSLLGNAGSQLFQHGNIVGRVGATLATAGWAAFGLASVLTPFFPAAAAAALLGRLDRPRALRLTILFGGLLLLVPMGIYTIARPLDGQPGAAGWIGRALGAPLLGAVGWVGAILVITFALAAVLVATIGWDPIKSFSGARTSLANASRTGLRFVVWLRDRLGRRAESAETGGTETLLAGPTTDEPWTTDVQAETVELPSEPDTAAAPPARRGKARDPTPASLPDSGDPTSADLPSTGLLVAPPPRDEVRNRRHLDGLGKILVEKLATFKIDGEIVGTTCGPVVTQFEVSPAPGVKVARIANLEADLALAMRAPSVRIVAPIPGKGAVGVEVPNPEPEMVYFREVIESSAFRGSRAALPLALGKDLTGRPYVADLARMPHLLIAGATGSGKSVCINTIVTSLVFRHSPQSLRLLMVDPKMVELSVYNDLPHLRHPVVTDNSEAAGVLKWAVLEMEWRYALLSTNNVRNLQDFNRRVEEGHILRSPEPFGEEGDPERWVYKRGALPYIVLVIDELADLMMTVQGDVEKPLALLAQKARAIGIHLILATQRPSVNVITGLIKANFPSRIAFRVSSKVDSRTIIDQNGADALLGNGDMLFLPPGRSDPLRIQGAFLSTEETETLMSWYRERSRARLEQQLIDTDAVPPEADILEIVRAAESTSDIEAEDSLQDHDALFREAAELCIQHQGGSTSLLQRRLRVGYGRAARIIDQLHFAGILGPADGSRPREVLVDLIQLDQMYPED